MTTIDLFWAVVGGNIVSMALITGFNYLLDKYYSAKRREKLDEILSKIDIDFAPPVAKSPTKKTVKKQAPKKNG